MHISLIKAAVVTASLLAGAAVVVGSQSAAIAGGGCCMQRDAVTDDAPWYQISEDFEECDALNQRLDRNQDDVFEPAGLIWWNIDC